jgi:hypothetical protein
MYVHSQNHYNNIVSFPTFNDANRDIDWSLQSWEWPGPTLRCTVDYHLFNNIIIVICGVSFQVSRRFPPGEERAE